MKTKVYALLDNNICYSMYNKMSLAEGALVVC